MAAGFAVLRYRLYDIDVVISRAALLALLLAFVTGRLRRGRGDDRRPARRPGERVVHRVVARHGRGGSRVPAVATVGGQARRPGGVRAARGAVRGVGRAEPSARREPRPGGAAARSGRCRRSCCRGEPGDRGPACRHRTGPHRDLARRGCPGFDSFVRSKLRSPIAASSWAASWWRHQPAALFAHVTRSCSSTSRTSRRSPSATQACRPSWPAGWNSYALRHPRAGESRRRLITAGDAERRRLERAIARDVVPHLEPLPAALAQLASDFKEADAARLEPLVAASSAALESLREITRGVFPAQLVRGGLGPALASVSRPAPRATATSGSTRRQRTGGSMRASRPRPTSASPSLPRACSHRSRSTSPRRTASWWCRCVAVSRARWPCRTSATGSKQPVARSLHETRGDQNADRCPTARVGTCCRPRQSGWRGVVMRMQARLAWTLVGLCVVLAIVHTWLFLGWSAARAGHGWLAHPGHRQPCSARGSER